MAFSPAPWRLAEATATIPIKSAGGKTVASVKYGETDLDDARLIAAAPDMFAVLKAVADYYSGIAPDQRPGYMSAVYRAIAKALGE